MTTPAPSGAMTPAAAALAELTLPGRTLAFCDETDLTSAATSTMVADIHAWVALILPSDAYPEVEGLVLAYQAENALPELHGTEMVNPKSGRPGKQSLTTFASMPIASPAGSSRPMRSTCVTAISARANMPS